ncbi:MAG: HSP20 family molecular chaperone IbpA [Myxococcota bacterium]|jgi:HSP20 family molecular chaperone IbpA
MLPREVDTDNIEATHALGVLTLKLPRTGPGAPRRISVSTAG